MAAAPATVYKVKTIDFLKRKVPIVLQNENGPCPLLALTNVLSLRNLISIPQNSPEVPQDQLIALVAGYLLDANSDERLDNTGAEYRANVLQNVSDAISLLPKLATGVDVNVRFDEIRGFEFTQDTAIFDLLDIRLVHGWLVDPQDVETAGAIGQHSYNELVSLLVSVLGDDTPSHLLTPTAMAAHSREASFSSRPRSGIGSMPPQDPLASSRLGSASSSRKPANAFSDAQSASLDQGRIKPAGEAVDLAGKFSVGVSALPAASQKKRVAGRHRYSLLASIRPHQGAPVQGLAVDGVDVQELQQALKLSMEDDGRNGAKHQELSAASGTVGSQQVHPQAAEQEHISPAAAAAAPPSEPLTAGQQPNIQEEVAKNHKEGFPPFQASLAGQQTPQEQESLQSGWPSSQPDAQKLEAAPAGTDPPVSMPEREKESLQSAAEPSTAAASSSGTRNPGRVDPRQQTDQPAPAYDDAALAKGKMTAFVDVDPEQYQRQQQAEASSSTPAWSGVDDSAQKATELQRASTVQSFLEANSSQLTPYGLLSLHQGLRPNELAVLFRNNHLNTIFYHGNAIWILVTDQGYLFEQNVVWEQLSDVNGNTDFAKSDFSRFSGQPTSQDVSVAADLAQAAFAAVVPPKGMQGSPAAADPDADMALALQLQEQEEFERRRQAEQQAQSKSGSQKPAASPRRTQPSPPKGSHGRQQAGSGKPVKPKSDKCTVM